MSEPVKLRKPAVRRTILIILICYWLAAFAATHVPVPHLADLPKNSDKGAHFIAYAGLAFLLGLFILATRSLTWRHYAIIFAVTVAYSIIDELLQIPVGRHADFADGFADALGSLAGLTTLHFSRLFLMRLVGRTS